MAQQTLKKLKYNGSEIIVEAAYRDGLGRKISDTYLTSVAWSGVTSKPFTSVDSGSGKDFTIDSNVLKLNHTSLATKYVELSTYNTAINGLQPKHTNLTALSNLVINPGSGLVKSKGDGTFVLDTNTYATTSSVAAGYQPLDADLTAIAALTGTSGLLKKTAANTWSLDTNTYATQTWVNSKGYQTSSQVSTAIQTALSGWHTFSYETASSLPTASSSTMYKIYLIPATNSSDTNAKEEYITIDNGSSANPRYTWEHIGSTNVDLSNYLRKYTVTDIPANTVLSSDLIPSDIPFVWEKSANNIYIITKNTPEQSNTAVQVEIEQLGGSERYRFSYTQANGTARTLDDIIGQFYREKYVAIQNDQISGSTNNGYFTQQSHDKIVVSATGSTVKETGYSIDASETTVANDATKVPLSKAVYAELAKKQNNLTFSTGLTNSSNTITLNTASASALGGIKIGTGLSISSGVVSVTSAPTAAAWSGNPFTVTDVTLDY